MTKILRRYSGYVIRGWKIWILRKRSSLRLLWSWIRTHQIERKSQKLSLKRLKTRSILIWVNPWLLLIRSKTMDRRRSVCSGKTKNWLKNILLSHFWRKLVLLWMKFLTKLWRKEEFLDFKTLFRNLKEFGPWLLLFPIYLKLSQMSTEVLR